MSRAVEVSEIDIREADFSSTEDAAAIVTVLDSYASDPVGGGEPLSADVRDRLVAALSGQSNALVLLALSDVEPVGLAVCFYGFSTFQARPLLNVHDLAVIPGYRGRGIGRKLLTDAETRARARGCCKLTLEVQDDNLTALGLYESFGFGDVVYGESGPTRFLSKPLA
ncbi:MAG: GNAT family N-acetyltransferase [Gammaproteobacteria bacterium]|nr:GNAT family N-acetyltransferase [Gammaproteobacteria bacterium]